MRSASLVKTVYMESPKYSRIGYIVFLEGKLCINKFSTQYIVLNDLKARD